MISENVRQAFTALSLNKKRTFLTMIGIIIGLCAVVLIVSFGDTVSDLFNEFVMLYDGQNNFYAYVEPDYEEYYSEDGLYNFDFDYSKYSLTNDEIYEIIDDCPEIVDISRGIEGYSAKAYSGRVDYYSKTKIEGVTAGEEITEKLHMVSGRFISTDDDRYKKRTAVISDKTAEEIFGSIDKAIGNTVSVKELEMDKDEYDYYKDQLMYYDFSDLEYDKVMEQFSVLHSDEFVVVGVYDFSTKNKEKYDTKSPREYSSEMYVPYSYLLDTDPYEDYSYSSNSYEFVVRDNQSKPAAISYVTAYLENRKNDIGQYFFEISDYAEEDGKEVKNVVLVFTVVFVLISSVSLIVGGIGLMNTMLVSVTERTKEIGIKKALGAKNREIRIQFLTESAVICLAACAIGIILAFFIGLLIETRIDTVIEKVEKLSSGLAYFLKNQTIHFTPSVRSIVISTLFSLAVGLIFGSYPANKGAKMQPVDALRYE